MNIGILSMVPDHPSAPAARFIFNFSRKGAEAQRTQREEEKEEEGEKKVL